MWEGFIWASIPALLGCGWWTMTFTPPNYMLTRLCFVLAALIFLGRLSWWILVEHQFESKFLTYFLICGIYGVVSILLCHGLQLVSDQEHKFKKRIKSQSMAEQPPTTLEQPTFREKIEKVTIGIGNNSMVYDINILRQQKVNPLTLGGYCPITAYVEGDKLFADVTIYGGSGKPPIEIAHNEFVVRPPLWDKNSNKDALEVVDENNNPVFQIIYRSQSQVIINGIFPYPGGRVVLSGEEGMLINPPLSAKISLKRIFKYPSWQYPGQLDDAVKPRE
ncbi:MAG: hypothetical protein ACLQUW_05730 [Desulfobaccales bacterium]